MELGWLDVCLSVSDVTASRTFYEGLGFQRVEGEDAEGWSVMVNGDARIGLFARQFMGEDAFSLNFRGGDVPRIAAELQARGFQFAKGPTVRADGGASATLKDPDGYTIFFDSAPGETKRT